MQLRQHRLGGGCGVGCGDNGAPDDDVTENVEVVETEKETNVKADPAAASAQTGDPEATTPGTSIEGDDENIQLIESINQQQTDCQ